MQHFKDEWPVLVILPNMALCRQWQLEINEWLGVPPEEIEVMKKGTQRPKRESKFVVTTYNLVQHLQKSPNGQNWQCIIADEAHKLKDVQSKRTRITLPLLHSAKRCIIMSGTPQINSGGDWYPLLSGVLGKKLAVSQEQFCQRYCEPRVIFTGFSEILTWKGVRPERREELNGLAGEAMVRLRKIEVQSQLPRRHKVKIMLQLKPNEANELSKQQKLVDSFEKEAMGSDEGGAAEGEEEGQVPVHEVNKLFAYCAEAKVPAGLEWLQANLQDKLITDRESPEAANSGKVIIFAYNHAVHDKIAAGLAKIFSKTRDIFVGPLHSETPDSKRARDIEVFKNNPKCRVALLSMEAFGTGLNLTVANTVIFAQMHWSTATMEQAEARVHRMGQTEDKVTYYYWVAEGRRKEPNKSPDLTVSALNKKCGTSRRD